MNITSRRYEEMLKCWGGLKLCACWLSHGVVKNMLFSQNTCARRDFVNVFSEENQVILDLNIFGSDMKIGIIIR